MFDIQCIDEANFKHFPLEGQGFLKSQHFSRIVKP